MCEHDRVHAIDGRQRIGTCQVADDDLDVGGWLFERAGQRLPVEDSQ